MDPSGLSAFRAALLLVGPNVPEDFAWARVARPPPFALAAAMNEIAK